MRGTVTIVEPADQVPAAPVRPSAASSVIVSCAHENIKHRQQMIDYKQELVNMTNPMLQIQEELASIEAARQRIAQMKEARRLRAEAARQSK